MQPYCLIVDDLDAIKPYPEFEEQNFNSKIESNNNFTNSILNQLDAPHLSISPLLALNDGFQQRSDDDESIDIAMDVNFQLRQYNQPGTPFAAIDSEIQESLSIDQCCAFDQINSDWTDINNIPDFLKYDLLNTKSRNCADPTLAELNANGKSIFDDLSGSDCLPLSEECSQFIIPTVPTSPQDSQDALILPASSACTPIPSIQLGQNNFLPNLGLVKTEPAECSSPRRSTLQELLLQNNEPIQRCPSPIAEASNEIPLASSVSQTQNYADNNTLSHHVPRIKRRQRTSTISSTSSVCAILAGTSFDTSQNTKVEPDSCVDRHDSDSTDEFYESEGEKSIHITDIHDHSDDERSYEVASHRLRNKIISKEDPKPKRRNKRGRYFWQYNLQAKGPKGNRLPLATEFANPHKLEQISDPVFSPKCIIKGIKHTGKARKGDGNDLTPNPEKLFQIGQSLKSLNDVINDLTPVNELPVNVRPKSKKEKNKLASRVCRLKKKAQHEANKLKLYGLQHEHSHLLHILKELKQQIKEENYKSREELLKRCCNMENQLIKVKVAGRTVEFVNEILDKVSMGIPSGGLDI